jgi:7-carboxy-7-deazaguanine synthase
MLVVSEIFHSIQGESTHAGRPCVFVRLAFCNLRCSYCDTVYAFDEGIEMSIDDIIVAVRKYNGKLVEITGGEPLLQPNVNNLMTQLSDEGFEILLETNGSLDISKVDTRVKRIVDFKCPSSNMTEKILWANVTHLKFDDEVKFVIGCREDYEWSKKIIAEHQINRRCPILMLPVYNLIEPLQLVEWILQDKLDVRFQLQMQKYIWSPETRGV